MSGISLELLNKDNLNIHVDLETVCEELQIELTMGTGWQSGEKSYTSTGFYLNIDELKFITAKLSKIVAILGESDKDLRNDEDRRYLTERFDSELTPAK